MIPFANFKFPQQTQARRRKVMSEVMPVGDDFAYFVLLSEAYMTFNEGERHIRSFDDLQDALGRSDDLKALQTARAEGHLTEGRHALPDAVAGYLADAGMDPPQVRRWMFGDPKPIVTTGARSEIKSAWAGLGFEEVEVAMQGVLPRYPENFCTHTDGSWRQKGQSVVNKEAVLSREPSWALEQAQSRAPGVRQL
jgi:hypothetical protein